MYSSSKKTKHFTIKNFVFKSKLSTFQGKNPQDLLVEKCRANNASPRMCTKIGKKIKVELDVLQM
jgi:hypothetical protein